MNRGKTLPVLAGILLATIGYIIGLRQGAKTEHQRTLLRYQLYGDIYRSCWQKILASPDPDGLIMPYYSVVTNTVADIRTISVGLNYYLYDTNQSPTKAIETTATAFRNEESGK